MNTARWFGTICTVCPFMSGVISTGAHVAGSDPGGVGLLAGGPTRLATCVGSGALGLAQAVRAAVAVMREVRRVVAVFRPVEWVMAWISVGAGCRNVGGCSQ